MDTLSKERRSALMARIRGDSLGPETRMRAALADALSGSGLEVLANQKHLPGKPDALVGDLAVFVHGCFWHGCPEHYRTPKTRSEHWDAHVGKNKRRDERVRRQLRRAGYRTAVVWEHDLKTEARAAGVAAVLARRAAR